MIGTTRLGSLIHSRTFRWACGSLPSISSRMTQVFRGLPAYLTNEVKDTGAIHESRRVVTSSCDRRYLDAFISSGSYPRVRAAVRARVVFPIPGEPQIRTHWEGVFARRYSDRTCLASECPIISLNDSGRYVSDSITLLCDYLQNPFHPVPQDLAISHSCPS